jgi:hypothetical protein
MYMCMYVKQCGVETKVTKLLAFTLIIFINLLVSYTLFFFFLPYWSLNSGPSP